jgi:signal transduction histidine kinase
VATDPERVRQVLGNLLSNALKYTPPGGRVTVRAEVRPRGHDGAHAESVAIDVRDSGPGIPPDKHEEVFEEFSRLAPDAAPGAGLGLAIARRVARALGGDVTVASEPGRGSCFTLWVPAARRRSAL